MKGKIQTLVGIIIVGLIVFGTIKSIYTRNFADPEFTVLKSTDLSSPINNALFWHEEELEKLMFGTAGAKLGTERDTFIKPLYDDLKTTEMVSQHMRTMSDKATKEMIALGAYKGTEPNVWDIAKTNGNPYVFKVIITNVDSKKSTGDLLSVSYLFSLHNTLDQSLIWEAESVRLAGFFGGMPDNGKLIAILKKHLKESNIIK